MTNYPNIVFRKSNKGYNLFEIYEPCLVEKYNFIIKQGFITDFASVPRFLWWFIPPHGYSLNPSIVHDYTCRLGLFSRITCDKIFLDLLLISLPKWQAYLMFFYVRLFGWITYKRNNE